MTEKVWNPQITQTNADFQPQRAQRKTENLFPQPRGTRGTRRRTKDKQYFWNHGFHGLRRLNSSRKGTEENENFFQPQMNADARRYF